MEARIAMNASGTYRVKLVSDETGFENKFSAENELRSVLDLPPIAELESPKADLILSNNELVDLIGPHLDVTRPYIESATSLFIQMHHLSKPAKARQFVNY